MTEAITKPEPRYTLELVDAEGGITTRILKEKPASGTPRLVIYGGGAYLLEHSKLLFEPNGQENWIGYYEEVVAFSGDIEREIVTVFDEVDLQHLISDGIDQAVKLANICTGCGAHWCGCSANPSEVSQYAKPCCAECSHTQFERCGAVAHAQRGIPEGYECLRVKGHKEADGYPSYHQRNGAAWPPSKGEIEVVAVDELEQVIGTMAASGASLTASSPLPIVGGVLSAALQVGMRGPAVNPVVVTPPPDGSERGRFLRLLPTDLRRELARLWDDGYGIGAQTPAGPRDLVELKRPAIERVLAFVSVAIGRLLSRPSSAPEPASAPPSAPVVACSRCNDTHRMELGDREVPCTACPTPCERCRFGGTGAYCEHVPCACSCHVGPG